MFIYCNDCNRFSSGMLMRSKVTTVSYRTASWPFPGQARTNCSHHCCRGVCTWLGPRLQTTSLFFTLSHHRQQQHLLLAEVSLSNTTFKLEALSCGCLLNTVNSDSLTLNFDGIIEHNETKYFACQYPYRCHFCFLKFPYYGL